MYMYLIAYIVIGLSLGGIIFILARRLPQVFYGSRRELESLRIGEKIKRFRGEGCKERFKLGARRCKKILLKAKTGVGSILGWIPTFYKKARLRLQFQKRVARLKNKGASGWMLLEEVASRINLGRTSKLEEKTSETPVEPKGREFFSELLEEEQAGDKVEDPSSEEGASYKPHEKADIKEPPPPTPKDEDIEVDFYGRSDSETEAEQQWIARLEEDPKDVEAYEKLGLLYHKQEDVKKARSCLQAALSLGSEKEKVRRVLEEIKGEI